MSDLGRQDPRTALQVCSTCGQPWTSVHVCPVTVPTPTALKQAKRWSRIEKAAKKVDQDWGAGGGMTPPLASALRALREALREPDPEPRP